MGTLAAAGPGDRTGAAPRQPVDPYQARGRIGRGTTSRNDSVGGLIEAAVTIGQVTGPERATPMAGELGFETGPYVNIASFCERALQETDGVLSLMRVTHQITVQTSGPEAPPE